MKYISCFVVMMLSVIGIAFQPMAVAQEAALKSLQSISPPINTAIFPLIKQININLANIPSLMTIKGIGKVKARALVEYREKNGFFTSIQELEKVHGFSQKLLNKIKDQIVFA